jgi:hypothetical protein
MLFYNIALSLKIIFGINTFYLAACKNTIMLGQIMMIISADILKKLNVIVSA